MVNSSSQTGAQPLIEDAADVAFWGAEADVVVVGYGIAGACAALSARDAGASVIVAERTSGCTGTTAAASGHFYLGGGTAVQQACGFEDSVKDMVAFLTATSRDPDAEKIRLYCEGSVGHFDWLESQGIPFERSYYPEKNVVQPGKDCLIWTGNENVFPFRDVARPAPRGHKIAFDGEEGGGGLALNLLAERAAVAGVQALFDTRVEALVVDGGHVVGVRTSHFGSISYIRARRGVILAAGGFGQNARMMAEYLPAFKDIYIQGSPYDDGTAINLGLAAGGSAIHMDQAFVTSPFYPPQQLLKAILVNRDGQRFVAEDSYHSLCSIAITEQPEGIAYLIVDSDIFAYPRWATLTNQQLIDGFETVAEMEAGLQLPVGCLQATLAEYNDHARRGSDPVFGKHSSWIKPLDAGPFAVFDLSFGRATFTGFTLGGLTTSADGEVIGAGDVPVEGLFAVGACASNLAQDSRGYASGTCLGEASFFGRRAGTKAAVRQRTGSEKRNAHEHDTVRQDRPDRLSGNRH